MLVAVVAMRVVQVIADEVIDVVAMRHGLVPAALTMGMVALVALAAMVRGARVRPAGVDLEDVLVDMVAVRVMEMALVKVVDVIGVLDRRVAQPGPCSWV
ncbi:MAG TPA: hypothetical protein VGH93_15300 [Solirubrobacteraceae bacterium]